MKNDLAKSAAYCKTCIAICFLAALLCALVFDAQTSWANDGQALENNNDNAGYVLTVTDESDAGDQESIGNSDKATGAEIEIVSRSMPESNVTQQADSSSNSSNRGSSPTQEASNSTGSTNQAVDGIAATKTSNATTTQEAGGATSTKPAGNPANPPTASDAMKLQAKDSSATSQLKSNPPAPLPDGDYIIRSLVASRSVLDVYGASKASGANVQLYSYNATAAQKWTLTYDAIGGFYTIANKVAGNVLDVSGASTANGANVHVWTPNGTKAQQWRIVRDGAGWRIESALKDHFVLDVLGANPSNGTNMQAYQANGTNAQRFELISLNPNVAPSTATVEEGAYVLTTGTGKVVDIASGSLESGANAQQYASNSTYAQRFYIEPDGTGFYRIFSVGSGLALDVSGANPLSGTNVHQYTWNGSAAQLWSLQANSDGTVTFISKCNGLALDVLGASTANGANLQVYTSNGTKAQKFSLTKTDLLSAGTVRLYSAGAITRVVDVRDASDSAGAALQIYQSNGTLAQRLAVAKTESGYTLRPVCSGLYAAASGSSVVQASTPTTWNIAFAKSGTRRGIVLSLSGKAVTATGTGDSSALSLQAPSGSILQSFCPEVTTLLANGVYTIASASNGKVLDVDGASWRNEANIQVYTSNGTGAQAFLIESTGGDCYRIVNAMTGKAVDVAGGNSTDGTNVQQYVCNGTDAQLWVAELSNAGHIVFVNKGTGKALNLNGTNVNIRTKNGASTQGWKLKPSTYVYDAVLSNACNIVQDRSSYTNYYIIVDLTNTRTIIFEGDRGNWTPIQNWVSTVGAPWSETPTGTYTISGRGYSFNGALGGTPYTCYYWTNFLDYVYLFHSIPYHQNTWTVQDGRLGEQASHGCVRLATDNAYWIYNNIPDGTRVYIYY